MGLLYSTYSYLASFTGKKSQIVLTQTKIKISANKLIHHLKLKEVNLQKKTKQMEENLLKLIKEDHMQRSAEGEKTIISDIIMNSYLLCAYQQLITCANVIKTQSPQLEKDVGKVSKRCITCICTVLYCYEPLHLQDCFKLDELVPRPHPKISEKDISQPLQDYVHYKKVDPFAMNIYVLEMCYRNKLSLQKVNEGGHKFIYNPSKLKQEDSRSSVMFALDIDLMEEQKIEGLQSQIMAE